MTGWFEYAICVGATTAVTIIVIKLTCKYKENALTVEMIVEVTRRASQAHIRRLLPCKIIYCNKILKHIQNI
ncbi:MAG: hypothetical protein ACKPKO_09740 [Candidatus Fonsibacter sp.]